MWGWPSSCHLKLPGGSNGPHRDRGRTRRRRAKLNPEMVVLSSSHLPPAAPPPPPVVSQPPASADLSHSAEGSVLSFLPSGVSRHPISGATRTCSKAFVSLTEQTGAVGTSHSYFNRGRILAHTFLFLLLFSPDLCVALCHCFFSLIQSLSGEIQDIVRADDNLCEN